MITVSRRYPFSASHRLSVKAFSPAENREIFGKCNNPYGHGHNYELEVSVRGEIDPKSGRVVDLAVLDGLIRHTVIERYDHRNLNEELPEFDQEIPTTENLGRQIGMRLEAAWADAFPSASPALDAVRIFETARNIIELKIESKA